MQLELIYNLEGKFQYAEWHFGKYHLVTADHVLALSLEKLFLGIPHSYNYCTSRDHAWVIILNVGA